MDMLLSQLSKLRESREQQGSENVKPHSPPGDIDEFRARLEKIKAGLHWRSRVCLYLSYSTSLYVLVCLTCTYLNLFVSYYFFCLDFYLCFYSCFFLLINETVAWFLPLMTLISQTKRQWNPVVLGICFLWMFSEWNRLFQYCSWVCCGSNRYHLGWAEEDPADS